MFAKTTAITFAVTIVIIIADALAKFASRGNHNNINKPTNFKLNLAWLFNFGIRTATIICFVILFITAFYPIVIQKQMISEFFLMAHVTFGVAFAVAFTLVVIVSIKQNKFGDGSGNLLKKICFWASLPIVIVTMGSIVLCMFKLFSTQSQLLLTDIHRYSGLVISSLIIIYIYCVIAKMVQRRK